MPDYDLTRMSELGDRYQRLRSEADNVRAELMAEVEAAEKAGVRQVDIVNASKLTRERLRQIRVAKAVAAKKATPKKRTTK